MPHDIAVLFADSHLQERSWSHRPMQNDSYYSFEQIVTYAIKNNLPMFGAGDLIDRNLNRSGPIVFLSEQLQRLKEAGINLYFTQGQHEMADVPWFDLGGNNVVHLHGKYVMVDGVKIFGLDYQPAGRLQEELERTVPCNADVLIAHQVWSDFMGSVANPQGGMHDVSFVKMVFTGDFHETHVIKARNKQGHEMTVISPGSGCLQSVSEPADKYFFVLQKDDDGALSVRKVNLLTRPFLDWDEIIQSPAQMDRFIENIDTEVQQRVDAFMSCCPQDDEGGHHPTAEHISEPIVRVEYSHRLERGAARIKAAVDRIPYPVHLFLKERPSEKPEVVERKSRRRSEGETAAQTMGTFLPRFLEDNDLSHLGADAQRLLDAAEPGPELIRMKQEAIS